MANSSGTVRPGAEPFGHSGGFTVTPEATLQWSGGSLRLTFFVGSRRMGRSYGFERDGRLYQAPIGYYANRGQFDLAPGYERDSRPDFSRPITAECLFCHATRVMLEPGQINRYRDISHGIGCERCHGTSDDHRALINPSKLPSRLRDSVCEQCHLAGIVRIERAGAQVRDFRPGQDLAAYVEVFVGAAPGEIRVNGHSEALAASRCKQASGDRLWCGTCHNPHRVVDFNAACRNCHVRPHRTGDCAGCHMVKGRASDGGHTVFTDHSMGAVRDAGAKLRSYFGRNPAPRDLGLAYVRLAARDRDASLIEKAWPLLRNASQAKDPALLNAIAGILVADGRRAQAEDFLRRSIEADPAQPDALRRLASLVESPAEARSLRSRAEQVLPAVRE
jgi:hypothetical protein